MNFAATHATWIAKTNARKAHVQLTDVSVDHVLNGTEENGTYATAAYFTFSNGHTMTLDLTTEAGTRSVGLLADGTPLADLRLVLSEGALGQPVFGVVEGPNGGNGTRSEDLAENDMVHIMARIAPMVLSAHNATLPA